MYEHSSQFYSVEPKSEHMIARLCTAGQRVGPTAELAEDQ